jgi:hypothetical protein
MFLKDVESRLKRGQKVPILREICSPKKCTPKIGANIGAITGILLIETKCFGRIWSFGENAMGLYMGGRQIFETSQEVHKRGG